MHIYWNKSEVVTQDIKMAAVLLFWDTSIAAVTSCESSPFTVWSIGCGSLDDMTINSGDSAGTWRVRMLEAGSLSCRQQKCCVHLSTK